MRGEYRRLWWLSAAAVALSLLVTLGVVVRQVQAPATIAVKITGLPGNAQPTVSITGTDGFKRSVKASTTLEVPAGPVRVIPAPVKAAGATYYTSDETLTVTVANGDSSRLVVDYRVAVSDRATILDPDATGLLARPSKSRLVFAGTSREARSLKSGDFVVAAETPMTPDGLVRKVRSVSEQGDRLVVRTEEASLRDAIPKAVLRFGAPSKPSSGLALAAHAAPTRSLEEPEPEGQAEGSIKLDTWQGKGKIDGLKCGANLPLLKAENNGVRVGMEGTEIGWTQSTVKLHVLEKTKLTIGAPVGASCSYDIELGRIRAPYATAQLLRVGPFKVAPEVSMRLGGEIKGAAGAKIEYENPVDYRLTARIGLQENSVTASGWPPKPSVDLIEAAEFKAKATLSGRITLKASPVIDILVAEVFVGTGMAFENEIDVIKGDAKVKFFAEGTAGVSVLPGPLGEGREASIAFPLSKPITIWKSRPGEVDAAKTKADVSKQVPCPSRASMKAAVVAATSAPSVHLGATQCWPGWVAVTWADIPATDVVTISIFTRNAVRLTPATHLVPVMDDPYEPGWLRDCRELRAMKPPARLISFVGCPTASQTSSTSIDGVAALKLIERQKHSAMVTADEIADMPGPLRAVTGSCVGSANGNCVSVFFFYGNRYVGVASGASLLRVVAQNGKEVTLSRPIFKDGDPTCCPSGGEATHRVSWDEDSVVVSEPSLPDYEHASERL